MNPFFYVLIFTSSSIFADVCFKIITEDFEEGTKNASLHYMTKEYILTEVNNQEANLSFMFHLKEKNIYHINHSQKEYSKTPFQTAQKGLKESQKNNNAILAQLQEQLKNLKGEEKKQVEEMIKNFQEEDDKDEIPLKYVKKEERKVQNKKCTFYELYEDKEKVEELCTIPFQELGITAKEFIEMTDLMSFGEKNKHSQELEKIGYPIQSISYEKGKKVMEINVTEILRQKIPQSVFQIPKNYKEKKQ